MSIKLSDLIESEFGSMNPEMDPERRRFLLGAGIFSALAFTRLLLPSLAEASINISNNFSHKNEKRKKRSRTEYIILHTTEASDRSSLNMVKKYGLTNYLVHTDGSVKRVIDKNRLARHAGRSMWEGKRNLDDKSVGIEVVGYHNRPITNAQFGSLKELLDDLQRIYNISDKDVIPHSMVAYGKPNRWHPYNHRGRKRCGMFFADSVVRKKLGLKQVPSYDPDVKAGRLKVADTYLNDILFGRGVSKKTVRLASAEDTITKTISAWAIAREQYNAPITRYTFPNGNVSFGHQIKDWGELPVGTKVAMNVGEAIPDDIEYFQKITGKDTAWKLAGKEFDDPTTIYFLPDGRVRRGDQLSKTVLDHIPRETEVLTGYVYGGKVSLERSAIKIAGKKWNDSSTFYRLPTGKIVSGDDIDPRYIPRKTIVFFRNGN